MSGSDSRVHAAWVVLFVLAAIVAACAGEGPVDVADGAPGRGIYVGSDWKPAREVTGHQVHVQSEKIACNKCHELGGDALGAVTPPRCAACHEKESRLEHAGAQAVRRFGAGAKADCTTCHSFTAAGIAHPTPDGGAHGPDAKDCNRCHHEQQGDVPGVRVHHESDCVKCHRPHEDQKPKPAPCGQCHEDITPTHWTRGRSVTEACETCHQNLHAPAIDARPTCVECHGKEKPKVGASALFAEGHTECVGCHRPHEFAKDKAISCRSCHEDIPVLGTPRVRAHNQCTSCHAAHDVKGTPDRACANCHRDKIPDHPKRGVAGTCVGCHDPHPPRASAHARVRNCSSCHQSAASDASFHAGTDCKRCHTPHDFVRPASDRRACTGCHAKQISLAASLAGHQKCEGCHGGLPHRPATLSAGCESCHASTRRTVATGHTQCRSCHEPHGGKVGTDCRKCHEPEHKTAPAGHRDCRSCHQPHTGSTSKVTCASCHAAAAKAPHAKVQNGCNACHRAHGPSGRTAPQPCSSCHAVAKLPGLHQTTKQHQDCARCHSGHGQDASGARRAGCLSCHADRKNHFPDAPRCTSCHLFEQGEAKRTK